MIWWFIIIIFIVFIVFFVVFPLSRASLERLFPRQALSFPILPSYDVYHLCESLYWPSSTTNPSLGCFFYNTAIICGNRLSHSSCSLVLGQSHVRQPLPLFLRVYRAFLDDEPLFKGVFYLYIKILQLFFVTTASATPPAVYH
jgi:hypothetical protein